MEQVGREEEETELCSTFRAITSQSSYGQCHNSSLLQWKELRIRKYAYGNRKSELLMYMQTYWNYQAF